MNKNNQKSKKGTDEIRETIDNTIEEIKNIPDIVSTQLGLNTEKIKGDLIPQLDKQKNRLDDFDKIDENIDSIRKEIINPVNEIIEKNSATSRRFNILFGTIGVIGTIFTIVGLFITLRAENKPSQQSTPLTLSPNPSTTEDGKRNETTTSFKDLRDLFSDNFSKECLELETKTQNQILAIKRDLKTNDEDAIKTKRDELLKATITIETNGCVDRFISNGIYDEIYETTALMCYKIKDYTILAALSDQYKKSDYEKSKSTVATIRLLEIEANQLENESEEEINLKS